jgi:hypothetical protein
MSKIKSIELPDDVEYKLTKVKSTNGYQPNISVGRVITGDLWTNPISVGGSCMVGRGFSDTITTSMVLKIKLTKKSNKIILHTENSIYELEEYNE